MCRRRIPLTMPFLKATALPQNGHAVVPIVHRYNFVMLVV